MDIPHTSGNYVVLARLNHEVELDLKTLRRAHLPKGIYCYCGSAHGSGGLCARISRHLRKDTPRFWHFDYLKDFLEILEVWWREDSENLECDILQALLKIPGVQVPVKGFGSSDCRKGCPAHLVQFPQSADPAFIAERLQETWPAFLPMFPAE